MWEQWITIYHKIDNKYIGYQIKATVRNTSIQNRNNTGLTNVDKAIIRIFDIKGYKKVWDISKGDIIVNKKVDTLINNAPMTELRRLYREENVYEVKSIDNLIFDDYELPNHIKIGAI